MWTIAYCCVVLAVTADAPPDAARPTASQRHPDAVQIYHCDFTDGTDANFDKWPDHWTRRRDLQHPPYLPIGIVDDAKTPTGRALKIELDGGAGSVQCPPIDISPMFSYVLEANMRIEGNPSETGPSKAGLTHDVAYVNISFYDAQQRLLESHASPYLRQAAEWQKIRIGPITPASPDVRTVVISLNLKPTERADLKGAALFSDVWLARLPRMSLKTNSDHNVYTALDGVEITCEVSGILERDPMMTFELIDISKRKLATKQGRLDGEIVAQTTSRASDLRKTPSDDVKTHGFVGTVSWKPPIKEYGFYRVRVEMLGRTGVMHERYLTLAVMRPYKNAPQGIFGWSLPKGDRPLSIQTLASLLDDVGINWVKFPVWFSEKDAARAERLAWLAEKLNSEHIEMVGVLDQPPAESRGQFGEGDTLLAANFMAETALWRPVLDPVLTRLSLKVRWWQLGADDDCSFLGTPQIAARVDEIKKEFSRFGQSFRLGLGWKWLYAPPKPEKTPWSFLSYSSEPPLTSDELATYLARNKTPGVQRWLILQPLDSRQYTTQERARDLVKRMLAVKIGGADAAFIPDPFDPHHGLMNPDGTPGELLIPWRTTSLMISGTQYIGSLNLPNGSRNMLFARGREAVLIVWNEKPTRETINLGEETRQVDLWGRESPLQKHEHQHAIEVGNLPTFITGVSLPLARWNMSLDFEKAELSSVFGRPQRLAMKFTNFFDQGISGTITVVAPSVWDVSPRTTNFKVGAGEDFEHVLQVVLRNDANSGTQKVRIDFEIVADRTYHFSVYRTVEVGLGDVAIETSTTINDRGELIVVLNLVNKTDEQVSFNCFLYAPDRRRQRQQILDLDRGRSAVMFRLPQGEELLGKNLWLRAEEISGDRVLNQRAEAKR